MARYQMDDGTVVDTAKASQAFEENTYWDGRNHISKATGSQWNHETLYRSRKGRYYIVRTSQWQGSRDSAEWVSKHAAARWLTANEYASEDIPEDLRELAEDVIE